MTRQIERLRPHEIEDELARRSLVYLPLGTIEWHCAHLPVGLDALTAHGISMGAAAITGGLVWPPLFYGTGGDHREFPWTVMMPDPAEIEALVTFTLRRLDGLGVRHAMIFSGHFADEQLAMIDRIASDWNATGAELRVSSTAVNRAAVPGFPPDHAGLFETTLMAALAPDLVQVYRLGAGEDRAARFDPSSPLWGVVGADPRQSPPLRPEALLRVLVQWLAEVVGGANT